MYIIFSLQDKEDENQTNEPEELDFMFDEELDAIDIGRKNTFTDW